MVGVMPRDFQWQFWSNPRQLWVPVGYTKGDYDRAGNSFIAFGRLKPGVTVAQADAEMQSVGAQLAREYPGEDPGMGATVMPMNDFGLEGLRTTMLALLAAVGFVLLIACVNIANLIIARGAAEGVGHTASSWCSELAPGAAVADGKRAAGCVRRVRRVAPGGLEQWASVPCFPA